MIVIIFDRSDKMKKELSLFSKTLVIVLLVILISMGVHTYMEMRYSRYELFANSSKMKMMIIEQEDSKDIYYILFNEKNLCESVFVEIKDYREDFLETSKTAETGFLYRDEKDGILYVEYTGLRGFSYDEIKEQFKDDKILKEW